MPVDPAQALGASLGRGTVTWNDDTVILYHLGLGAGVPPTDPAELDYVFERSLKVLPTFAVIPAHGTLGKLSTAPGLSYDPALVLHGEHEIEVPAAIPPAATVTNEARVAGVYDKGKAALVVSEVRSTLPDGTLAFVNRFSIFLRGEGGFGGDPGPTVVHEPPPRPPDAVVECPTLPQQALLYRLSGDKNPLHADPAFAARGGFHRPILHGLCSFGIVCKAAVDHLLGGDPAAVVRYRARFSGVVFPGETIAVSLWREGQTVVLTAKTKERDTPVLTNAAITVR